MKRLDTGDIPHFKFNTFTDNDWFQHAVFTRIGGVSREPYATLNLSVSVPDDEGDVRINRARAYGIHNRTNDTLVHAHLCHDSGVTLVSQDQYGSYVGPTDGLITATPGCGLTMNYADCAAIFLIDPEQKAIGLGHAGWLGAVRDLPGSMVRAMRQTFGSKPADIYAGVGPCIASCCYEIGQDVIEVVRNSFPDSESLLLPPPGSPQRHHLDQKRFFDLPQANYNRLAASGVRHIELSGLCTACRTDLFFSHRKEKGQTGRFGAILTLK